MLKELDWDCINNDYWNQYRDGKRKKCSEILIYNSVNIDYIDAICCKDIDTKDKVFKNLNNVDIDLITAPELFF